MRKIALGFSAGFFFFAFSAFAAVIRVPQDQPTVQAGINAAVNGDTVLVAPGTFFVNLNFGGKNILLKSDSGATSTILKPSNSGQPVVTWNSGEETTSVINGFTITGATADFGGVLAFNSSPRIKNCIVHSNTGTSPFNFAVGGICLVASHGIVESCTVFNNTATKIGGGIGCFQSANAQIKQNLVLSNSASNLGGGITLFESGRIAVYNNTVAHNTAGSNGGGGIISKDGGGDTIKVINNILYQNTGNGVSRLGTSAPLVSFFNDFFANSMGPMNGVSIDTASIFLDPTFKGGMPFDYHLSNNSPCINAGHPAFPVPLCGGIRIDIGAFEVELTCGLAAPANGSRILVKQPTFVWYPVSDTSSTDTFYYRVILATDSAFVDSDSSPVLSDTTWQFPFDLEIATNYFWNVIANNTANDTVLYPGFTFFLKPTMTTVPDDRPTIQQAIDIGINGDTVLVDSGSYTQNILIKGKRIKVLSKNGPKFTTIQKLVDGAPLVTFFGTEDSTTVLSGFTLKGARFVPNGAAVSIGSASPIVENNLILDNSGDSSTISVSTGSPKLRRNVIADNGAGLAAILFMGGSGGDVINCTIANNFGDGIRVGSSMAMKISNNIIASNTGYGIRSTGGVNSSSNVSYNDIFGNTAGTYFAIIPTGGDIFQNPLFRGGNPFDYRLLPGSPCIDAGDPASPVPPGGGARIDMGAFEFTALVGDMNGDGLYTSVDVVLILNCVFLGVGNCSIAIADVNCDGSLTSSDVVLELNWVFLGTALPCGL